MKRLILLIGFVVLSVTLLGQSKFPKGMIVGSTPTDTIDSIAVVGNYATIYFSSGNAYFSKIDTTTLPTLTAISVDSVVYADDSGNLIRFDNSEGDVIQFFVNSNINWEFEVANKFVYVNDNVDLSVGGQVLTDTVYEVTSAHGVFIDGVLVKDGGITLSAGATVDNIETTITDDDTHIPTSGAVVDRVNTVSDSVSTLYTDVTPVATTLWLIEDTTLLAGTGLIDSCNTTWVYELIDNEHGSDSLLILFATQRCRGTSVDITLDIIKNDTLDPTSSVQNDTIVASWNITDESGAAEDAASLSNTVVAPGEVVWFKFSAVATEPTSFYLKLFGKRQNRSY